MKRQHWLVLAGYVALMALMTYPLILQGGRAIPGDGFDGWQNYWNLWWVRKALLELGTTPFFTGMLYHPTGVSLAFQTMNLFNGLLTLPVGLLAGLLPAYNVVAAFGFVMGAFGAYLLARYVLAQAGYGQRWTVWPAFLAGVVFAYAPFHFAHLLGHMQVFSLEWLPFAALALLRGLERVETGPRSARTLLTAVAPASLMLILAALCDWYFALYLALFTALLAAWRLAGGRLRWRGAAFLTLAWLGFLIVLAPLWLPMVQEARTATYMVPEEAQATALSADLLGFVTPNEFHPLWGDVGRRIGERFTSTTSERIVFAGFVPLALALLAAMRTWRPARFWWAATLVFVLCALGPRLHVAGQASIPLPYALMYRYVPFVRIARSIARWDAMVMLSLAVLAALGLAGLIGRRQRSATTEVAIIRTLRGRRVVTTSVVAIALVCFEFLSIPYPFSAPDTPAFYSEIAAEAGDFAVLNLPMNWDRPGYLLYQTVHGKALIAGYISRDDPRTLVYRTPVLQEFRYLGPDILCDDVGRLGSSVLDWLDIRYVILDRYQMPSGDERDVTDALAGQIFAGVAPAYEDERVTVFRAEPPARRLPFPILGEGWGPRQSDGARVWREIASSAGLTVVWEGEPPRRLSVRASGPAGSRLVVSDAHGVLAELPLTPEPATAPIAFTPAETGATLTFSVAGPGPCRVSQINIE